MAHSSQQPQTTSSSSSSSQQSTTREEFVVRVPAISDKKKYSVLKFSNNLGIDVTQWGNEVNLSREDNERVFVETTSEPKFGAGSEFGKEAREEARRKKLGFRRRRYRIDAQPWVLTLPGKQQDRKFRGQKEGGVTQNADYWIFVKAGEGVFDAHPVSDWYNFMPISRYKTLDIDEAEEQFQKRSKVLNQFALKLLVKGETDGGEDSKIGLGKAASGGKISGGRGKDDDDDLEDVKPAKGLGKAGKNKKQQPKKRKKKFNEDDDDPMASADSDDGDEEGRELDYMSSSSESSSDDEPAEQKVNDRGVDEEVGMRQLIASEDEDEEETEKEAEEQKPDFNKAESMPTSGFDDAEENESDSGSDSDDPDKEDIKSALFIMPQKTDSAGPSASTSAASTSGASSTAETNLKRKIKVDAEQPAQKKHKGDKESKGKSDKPMSMEDEVRRLLQRRSLSTTDLVSKFKRGCQGMSKEEIVQKLADILKRLKPRQERRNGVLYFSLVKNS